MNHPIVNMLACAGLALLACLLLSLTGCSVSLERARVEGATEQAASRDEDHCRRLSRAESALRYVAVGSAMASGSAGLVTIETDDRTADQALAISAAGLAVGAVVAESVRAELAADWAGACQ